VWLLRVMNGIFVRFKLSGTCPSIRSICFPFLPLSLPHTDHTTTSQPMILANAALRQSSFALSRSSPVRSRLIIPFRGLAKGSPTQVAAEETREANAGYGIQIVSGRHTLYSDLMPEAGGNDKGPSPKEYALVALSSCTLMTVRMYSDSMIKSGKWPGKSIEKLSVSCSEHGDDQHVPLNIQVELKLRSNLDEEQIKRLVAAAEKCPVKRMMKGGVKNGITTVLVKD